MAASVWACCAIRRRPAVTLTKPAGELTFTHLISAPRHQLQPRYLLDIVGQLAGDTALIKLADPDSPTLIQDRNGVSALYVLMPLRVRAKNARGAPMCDLNSAAQGVLFLFSLGIAVQGAGGRRDDSD